MLLKIHLVIPSFIQQILTKYCYLSNTSLGDGEKQWTKQAVCALLQISTPLIIFTIMVQQEVEKYILRNTYMCIHTPWEKHIL